MKASFKQAAEAIERVEAVEAQRQNNYVTLARFFAEAAKTDKRFEYEAQFYARLAATGMTDAEIQKAMGK